MLLKTCLVQSVFLVIPAILPGKMQLPVCCVGLVRNNLNNDTGDKLQPELVLTSSQMLTFSFRSQFGLSWKSSAPETCFSLAVYLAVNIGLQLAAQILTTCHYMEIGF